MQKLTPAGERAIDELAKRYGFGRDAVLSLLESIARGNGTMAQFDHPEFGGSGQWMGGGMTMVSDMFNDSLKGRVAGLASELAALLVSEPAAGAASRERASLFVPPGPGSSRNWWPAALGAATSTGAQNDVRYAYFAHAHRLAIEIDGRLTLYDTLDHEIGGVSQQQSRGSSLSFHSQHGLIDLADLPVVSAGRE